MSRTLDLDRRHVWHPFTQHATERDPVAIARAEGAVLYDEDGREILDLIASWWTCVHGHAHPHVSGALAEQAATLEHVMFAGFTHAPAAELAGALSAVLPGDLNRLFFSDNGSTAVEVALKLAYQYQRNQGQGQRRGFLAFDGGYHGDTLGAMSVGRGSGFFTLFEDLMCQVLASPYAPTWEGDADVETREAEAIEAFEAALESHGETSAAVIIEPLMQGAGGLRICRPDFVRHIAKLAHAAGLLVIFDEVATGFGRTGTMFAAEQVGIVPDIMTLSKGLTAGYMALSVTVARDPVFEAFLGEDFGRALAHGHSYTANPLACRVALASLELFQTEATLSRIAHIADRHRAFLPQLMVHPRAEHARALGTVLAFDLAGSSGEYMSADSMRLRNWCLDHGLNIRPLGGAVYLMPPYCITDAQLDRAYTGLLDGLDKLAR